MTTPSDRPERAAAPPVPAKSARWDAQASLYIAMRLGTIVFFGMLCAVMPQIGDNHLIVAAALVGVFAPSAAILEWVYYEAPHDWHRPALDLFFIVTLVHLLPQHWWLFAGVSVIVISASATLSLPKDYKIYAALHAFLSVGLGFAAWFHKVPDAYLMMLVLIGCQPVLVFYAYRESIRAAELHERATQSETLRLIAGGVAHDFNNALTGISGKAELALLEMEETHPAARPIEDLIDSIQRASLLTAQLMAFSNRKVGARTLLNLDDEVRTIAGLVTTILPKHTTLRIDSPALLPKVRANRAQLQQVIMNLIINAGDASHDRQGEILIRLRANKIAGQSEVHGMHKEVICEVIDQGVGMTAEQLENAFTPFYTTKSSGNGLGLASAKQVVEDHNGLLSLTSAPGQGTTATLCLPAESFAQDSADSDSPELVANKAATSITPELQQILQQSSHSSANSAISLDEALRQNSTPTQSNATRRKVLIIDDEAPVRQVIAGFLNHAGFEHIQAENGETGLQLFAEQRENIAMAVIDLKMPGIGGWETLAQIRAQDKQLPVLICSGYDPESGRKPVPDEHLRMLRKPFKLNQFTEALEQLLATDLDF